MNLDRQFAAYVGAGALLAAPLAASTANGAYQARKDLERHPLPGERLDVGGGHRMHVRRLGPENSGPVVLFEAGLSCPLDAWAWIQPEIARHTATLSYDRSGLGGSDRGPTPRTAARYVDELELVLAAAGVDGPLVVVSHSFGGLVARAFAARHPERIAGMVMADVSHPDQLDRSRRQRAGMSIMWAQLQQAATVARLGLNRLTGKYMMTGISDLPEPDRTRAVARVLTAKANTTACAELDAWLGSVNDEVRGTTLPDGCPLAVLTAGKVIDGDPVHGELQQELVQLSRIGTWARIDDADHLGLIMNESHARHVTKAVNEILAAARVDC